MREGDIVIAAITSCTNTSNPAVLAAAGLLARNAQRKGLKSKPWVKTSLSPGSAVVSKYLNASGLQQSLDALGFHVVGYGCMTCAGGSGSLAPEISSAIEKNDLTVCAALSGNRNFEGRIHPEVRAAYLLSPPLVVALIGKDLARAAGEFQCGLAALYLVEGEHYEPYSADAFMDAAQVVIEASQPTVVLCAQGAPAREWLPRLRAGQDSWPGAVFGREIEPILVRGGKLLIGVDTADEPHRLERLKEGRITRFRRGGHGRGRGWQAMSLLDEPHEIQHLGPQVGWQRSYFGLNVVQGGHYALL